MYKFGIHLFEHFSSNFGEKTWSNGVKPKRNRAGNMRARRRRVASARRRMRTPRQADVHRSVRCAEAHVRDVGGHLAGATRRPAAPPCAIGSCPRTSPHPCRAHALTR
jgi:hypothetical protein